MKLPNISEIAIVSVLFAAAPAFAQSPPTGPSDNAPAAQNQHPRQYEGAAEWHKQHTDGGAVEAQERQKQQVDGADNPSNPREYEGAAEWHKQHTQSLSHSDGSPDTALKNN